MSEEEAEPWDLLANALGSLSEIEDDEDVDLDFQEGFESSEDPDDPYYKVPLEKASNLIKIRKAASGLKSGEITRERYVAIIRPFLQPLENGLQLLKSDTVKAKVGDIPEDQKAIFSWMHQQLTELNKGMQLMYRYRESDDLADVEQGLAIVEQAMGMLDRIQDQAIEAGQEEELRTSMTD